MLIKKDEDSRLPQPWKQNRNVFNVPVIYLYNQCIASPATWWVVWVTSLKYKIENITYVFKNNASKTKQCYLQLAFNKYESCILVTRY